MDITKDEAQDYLETIRQVQRQTRRTLARGGTPLYMIIWGMVWFIGYLGNHFLNAETAGLLWLGISVAGFVASFAIGWWTSIRVRSAAHDVRIGLFWIAWVVYTSFVIWLGGVRDPLQVSVVVSVMAMFGYVVMGLWLWTPLAGIGLGVTAVILLAFLFAPHYLNLVMAFLGGGTLIFIGWYIRRQWR